MRVVAVALLALATVWPLDRRWRAVVGAAAGVLLVVATWSATFLGWQHLWALPLLAAGGALAVAWSDGAPAEPLGWWWVALAGAVGAIYACVPETGQMDEMAVLCAVGVAVEGLRRRPLPPAAIAGAWGLVAWSALYGASGRGSAVVGGVFALVAPLVALRAGRASGTGWAGLAAASVWVVAGFAVARTGGIDRDTGPAVVAVAIAAPSAAAVTALGWRLLRRAPSAAAPDRPS